MKTLRVDAKLRNNLLIKAREALGFQSAAEAARGLGLPYAMLVSYETLYRTPWRLDGNWRPSAVTIAHAYKKRPEALWPEEIARVKQTHTSMEVDAPESMFLEAPETPEEKLLSDGRAEVVRNALDLLSPREQRVLNARFGLDGEERTLAEIGVELGCGSERVRQIEMRALNRLRGGIKEDGEPRSGFKELLAYEKLTSKERREKEDKERLAKISGLEAANREAKRLAKLAVDRKRWEQERAESGTRPPPAVVLDPLESAYEAQFAKETSAIQQQSFAERGFTWVANVSATRSSRFVRVVCALKGSTFTIVAGGVPGCGSFDVHDKKLVKQFATQGWVACDESEQLVVPCDSIKLAFAALGVEA